jgi:hypothetical protein
VVAARQAVDRVDVGGQIPVLDADGAIQDGLWVPPADAAAPMSYALELGQQRQVQIEMWRCGEAQDPSRTEEDKKRPHILYCMEEA